MENGKSSREVEIKLRIEEPGEGRRMLEGAGFAVRRTRHFEANVLYDTGDGRLRKEGKLLRLRQVGDEALLTYKGPPEPGEHKVREEVEVSIGSADRFAEILGLLDMWPTFRYEKYRTEYERRGEPGIAMLDETPIGSFVELEGSPDWINETARELGFDSAAYILASYGRLYVEWCTRERIPVADMVFGDSHGRSIRRSH